MATRWLTVCGTPRRYPAPKPAGYSREIDITVRDTLLHLLEEEIQHRGELNALLWQIDVEPPVLDWIDWKYVQRTPPSV